ncbi:diguanylate cyclase domain-containing protein [Streptomyces sp. NBC_01201]|uniref:diguanylate cyclase domain-containing protein n=1 Tax=Streptomyces sp. NBC_01201 TaxID=2903770 RepID=UPI002E11D9D1
MRDRRSYQLTRGSGLASVQESRNPRASDLDHFKAIDDTLGHAAGDAVISATADRLSAWTGSRAAVGRLGGDEFALRCASAPNGARPASPSSSTSSPNPSSSRTTESSRSPRRPAPPQPTPSAPAACRSCSARPPGFCIQ